MKMNKTYQFSTGNSPLLISIPHAGTQLTPALAARMTPEALRLPDVDRHLVMLYDMAVDLDISVISAEYARYVIDLNRPLNDSSLYPGLDTTGLCPIDTFENQPIYIAGQEPNGVEIKQRIAQYWQPYHTKLAAELERIRKMYGFAILWDAHSIASQVPRFFSGELPDLNFGTDDGKSCHPLLQQAVADSMRDSVHAKTYTHIFNARFKGGYITRHYGAPKHNIHAIQLEMSQRNYMQEQYPYDYNVELAEKVKPLLTELLKTCLNWTPSTI
jgi:N-formylglutamate deformylase